MLTHWSDDFALIIPKKTGITWQHQTNGVACNQIYIEGLMIPLAEPRAWDTKWKTWVNYLNKLTNANYCHKDTSKIWEKINGELDFEYKDVDAPKGQPNIQEGIKWIFIKKIKYPKRKDKRKISGIIHKRDCKTLDEEYKDLIGKTVALIYPNCD